MEKLKRSEVMRGGGGVREGMGSSSAIPKPYPFFGEAWSDST
jgi:hypothetical protein